MKNVPTWNEKNLTDFASVAFQCENMAAVQFMDTPFKGSHLEGIKPIHLAKGHAWHRSELAEILHDVAIKHFNSAASKEKVAKFWQKHHIPA